MISIARLIDNLDGDWVAFDRSGEPKVFDIPGTAGPATFLVAPVTDAVKRVDGDAVESLDRDKMWVVEAMLLNRTVLRRLEPGEVSMEQLVDSVRRLGYTWQISPISVP